jgi:crotonobetainyl-CoA:carnitine CoA-transferase CaiB-like acyl-CoA transferase|tara:strand:- start:1719 stop:2936 length:1218 start_codon:yes stop_codon:yes gene_type:complete
MENTSNNNLMQGALKGIKVIDISNFLAGPVSSMFLGDYGADVIKVEKPDLGDEIRYWGNNKNGIGLMYKLINRNKRSITADLRTKFGVQIIERLVKDADIIIENYRKGTLEKWGLSYESLNKINPGLIMVRITGFGQTGPNSHKPGFGTLAEGYAGFANINGYPDKSPLLPGFGLADETSGLMGAFLALTALRERDQNSGIGQVVEFGIYEPLFTLLGPQVVDYDQLGIIQQRNGSRLPFTAPRNTYITKDNKWVSISGSAQSTFERMCDALDIKNLISDVRFLDNRLRIKNAEALDEALQKAILKFDQSTLIHMFDKFGAAIAACNNIEEIFQDEHFKSRQNIIAVDDKELGGSLKMQNVVGKFSRTPGKIRHAGPKLGEHNYEILIKMLGFSEDELKHHGYEW